MVLLQSFYPRLHWRPRCRGVIPIPWWSGIVIITRLLPSILQCWRVWTQHEISSRMVNLCGGRTSSFKLLLSHSLRMNWWESVMDSHSSNTLLQTASLIGVILRHAWNCKRIIHWVLVAQPYMPTVSYAVVVKTKFSPLWFSLLPYSFTHQPK